MSEKTSQNNYTIDPGLLSADVNGYIQSTINQVSNLRVSLNTLNNSLNKEINDLNIETHTSFSNKNDSIMKTLMDINLSAKTNILNNIGNTAPLRGVSDNIHGEVLKPSYVEGNNYLDFVTKVQSNENQGKLSTRSHTINNRSDVNNLYPDELEAFSTGTALSNLQTMGDDVFSNDVLKLFKTGIENSGVAGEMSTSESSFNVWNVGCETNSILYKTKKLFKDRKINTIISRFGTGVENVSPIKYNGQIATQYGESRGRNLLTKEAEKNNISGYNINGYKNPYCRVWTHHYKYDSIYKTMRPFTEIDTKDSRGGYKSTATLSDVHNWKRFKTEDSYGWKDDNSSYDKSVMSDGMVNFAPMYHTEDSKKIHTKDCMFSIENLAWRKVNPYVFEKNLSWEQRGPNGGRIMWFPPYGLTFSETTQAKWNSFSFIGRGEEVYTYQDTVRSGTLSFLMVVDHPSIINYVTGLHADKTAITDNDIHRYFAGCDRETLQNTAIPTPLEDERNILAEYNISYRNIPELQKIGYKLEEKKEEKPQSSLQPVSQPSSPTAPTAPQPSNPPTPQPTQIKTSDNVENEETSVEEEVEEEVTEIPPLEPTEFRIYCYFPPFYSGVYDDITLESNTANPKVSVAKYLLNGTKCGSTDFPENAYNPLPNSTFSNDNTYEDDGGYQMGHENIDTNNVFKCRMDYIPLNPINELADGSSVVNQVLNYLFENKDIDISEYEEKIGLKYFTEKTNNFLIDGEHNYSFSQFICCLCEINNIQNNFLANKKQLYSKTSTEWLEKYNKLKELLQYIKYDGLSGVSISATGICSKQEYKSPLVSEIHGKRFLKGISSPYFQTTFKVGLASQRRHTLMTFFNKYVREKYKWKCEYDMKDESYAYLTVKIDNGQSPDTGTQNDTENNNESDNNANNDISTLKETKQLVPYSNKHFKSSSLIQPLENENNIVNGNNTITIYSQKDADEINKFNELYMYVGYKKTNQTIEIGGQKITLYEDLVNNGDLWFPYEITIEDKKDKKWIKYTPETVNYIKEYEITNNKEKKNNVLRYDQEYYFFKKLQSYDNIVYKKLVDKLQFFDPAFHSMTPEGFNGRLTFLNQCMRQGDIINNNIKTKNTSFGRSPYCVLRIGDFYNQMIIIENMSINYDVDGGVHWDLNAEGIGVQPLLAQVQLNIKLIGGGDVSGPIRRLQNAMTFNYYANTSMYDNRADSYVYDENNNLKKDKSHANQVASGDKKAFFITTKQ